MSGGGDNGYLDNMNLETIRHLNTVTCCFADDFQAKEFEANEDSTTDICRYNLAPPQSNHIRGGVKHLPGGGGCHALRGLHVEGWQGGAAEQHDV